MQGNCPLRSYGTVLIPLSSQGSSIMALIFSKVLYRRTTLKLSCDKFYEMEFKEYKLKAQNKKLLGQIVNFNISYKESYLVCDSSQ